MRFSAEESAAIIGAMSWEDFTPAALRPAIKHLQEQFDESDWKCSWITQVMCFGALHPGRLHPLARDENEFSQYRVALGKLLNIVGVSAAEFPEGTRQGVPSAIFHAYAELYRNGLNLVVRDMFRDALQIAISNVGLVGNDPVGWAKTQVENRIRNGKHRFRTWIKNVSDVQPATMSFTDADVDEMIHWRSWRAPRFIHMHPSGNTPYDERTAWVREDEQRTAELLDGLSDRFTQFVSIELDRLAGNAHVQLAKRGGLSRNAGTAQSSAGIGNLSEADNRHFARTAIGESRKSVAEDDGRVHPRVGTVVVKDGKVLAVAHRGEIASGNHAEFVALEKKLADVSLAGATVYTTLEPCTTRNHPKVPCAERLIERKVGRVVIGMLDPDDRIRGRGLIKLRDANVAVELFPADLMSEAEELNREFKRHCVSSRGNAEREAAIGEMMWKIRKLKNEVRSQHPGKNVVANVAPSPDDDIDIFREALRRIEAEDGRAGAPGSRPFRGR